MTNIPYAEDVGHYWKTSTSSPDVWMEKTKKLIRGIKGVILSEMIGMMNGKSGIMLEFVIEDDHYRILFPILPSRKNEELAAKRQAVTALYYEVKTLVVSAKFRGVKATFHSYLLLPDGRIASQLSSSELAEQLPQMFLPRLTERT